jgi:hypothetical protein
MIFAQKWAIIYFRTYITGTSAYFQNQGSIIRKIVVWSITDHYKSYGIRPDLNLIPGSASLIIISSIVFNFPLLP